MSYAAVLTHVEPDAETATRLQCAVDIARRFDAAIIGVGAEMVPPLAFDGGFYSVEADWVVAMRNTIDERLAAARRAFESATAGFGERARFESGFELPTRAMASASRAADLIVAGGAPRRRADPYRCSDPAELAIISGRPVLVAPPSAPALKARRIVLAWKDAREARRAMSDALPFFERAERVIVAAVCESAGAKDAKAEVDDVAGALRRRGIAAEAQVVEDAHPSAHEVMRLAAQTAADLVVCGAYGHSRLGEWVFGGFTFDLLQHDEAYVLFSH